jgi:hypothetical protein
MKLNGRVQIKEASTNDLFNMYDKIPSKQCATFRNPTQGIWDETSLSKLFFSDKNIQILQNGIRAGVYEKSNKQYIVSEQDCDVLKVIMRSVFLQNASHNKFKLDMQLVALNDIVLNYSIRQVYSEAQGYKKYMSDISTLPVPIHHPVVSSTKKNKQLELKQWF